MKLTSGETLRALMNQRGYSNADVGNFAECSRTFISALVNGRRSTCTEQVAKDIARCLAVPVEVLFVAQVSAPSGRTARTQRKDGAA